MERYNAGTKLLFSKKNLPKKVVISYVVDYLIIIVLAIGFFALDAVEPFHQPFSLRNYTLRYPYAVNERVTIPLLFALVVVFPAVVIAVYTLVIDGLFAHDASRRGKYRMKERLWELNTGLLGLLLASGAAFVITGALKNATGKPRPDFVDRCKPNATLFDISSSSLTFELQNASICTQTDPAIMKDAFRSFPSGHSSSSWGGLFYLSLYLAGKLHLLDHRGEVWKTFVVLAPTLGAALIAISRIEDARHHPFDVITGSMLGAVCAFVAYRQYFPPLHEAWRKGRAYPIRSWGTGPLPPLGERGADEGARDRGKEPMRATSAPLGGSFGGLESGGGPTAYERPGAGGGAPTAYERPGTAGAEAEEGNSNVFRAQVQATERMRQGNTGLLRISEPQPIPPPLPQGVSHARPTGAPAAARGHVEQEQSWGDNSSESDAVEAYEMREGYRAPPVRDPSPEHRAGLERSPHRGPPTGETGFI